MIISKIKKVKNKNLVLKIRPQALAILPENLISITALPPTQSLCNYSSSSPSLLFRCSQSLHAYGSDNNKDKVLICIK